MGRDRDRAAPPHARAAGARRRVRRPGAGSGAGPDGPLPVRGRRLPGAAAGYHAVQHGLHHAHEAGRPEFDRDDASELDRRLANGDRHFHAAGLPPAAAFVAPYDRLSATALRLVACRFPVVSTGWYERGRVPGRWDPARLLQTRLARAPHWRLPGTSFLSHPGCILSYDRDPATMWPALRAVIDRQRLTVVVTHHWEYVAGGAPNEPFIAALHEVAEELARRDDVRVVTFADVAAGHVPLR